MAVPIAIKPVLKPVAKPVVAPKVVVAPVKPAAAKPIPVAPAPAIAKQVSSVADVLQKATPTVARAAVATAVATIAKQATTPQRPTTPVAKATPKTTTPLKNTAPVKATTPVAKTASPLAPKPTSSSARDATGKTSPVASTGGSYNLPTGYQWTESKAPTSGDPVYYAQDTAHPGWEYYVGPDQQYYLLKHEGPISPADVAVDKVSRPGGPVKTAPVKKTAPVAKKATPLRDPSAPKSNVPALPNTGGGTAAGGSSSPGGSSSSSGGFTNAPVNGVTPIVSDPTSSTTGSSDSSSALTGALTGLLAGGGGTTSSGTGAGDPNDGAIESLQPTAAQTTTGGGSPFAPAIAIALAVGAAIAAYEYSKHHGKPGHPGAGAIKGLTG